MSVLWYSWWWLLRRILLESEKANTGQLLLVAFNCLWLLINTSNQLNDSLTDASPDTWWIFFSLFSFSYRSTPQTADAWKSLLMSLAGAESEVATGELWWVAVVHGVVQPTDIPQCAGILKGAAYYLWMVQAAKDVGGQQDQAVAQQELLRGWRSW